jgi:hypothetical protein
MYSARVVAIFCQIKANGYIFRRGAERPGLFGRTRQWSVTFRLSAETSFRQNKANEGIRRVRVMLQREG